MGDGVFYRLSGANPISCTPMWYGGYYLEADRAILASARNDQVVVMYVEGDEGTYLDCVSDLPADVIAWNHEETGVSDAEMRKLFSGLTASSDPESNFDFQGARAFTRPEETLTCGSV